VDHPDDLFSSAAFAEILDDLAHEFDYVIIDSPALLADSGTEAILPLVDGVVMVVRLGGAAAPDLAECKRRMENVAARALGLVIYDFPNNQSRSRRRIKVHAQ
jgi:Mrp family chromosome partitioning ATPase